jgi:hypothetical protein
MTRNSVEKPSERSLSFALEPIGSSGDLVDKLGFLLLNGSLPIIV